MNAFISIFATLGPVFVLVLIGYLCGRWRFPHPDFWPQAERFTYYLLFPALLVLKLGSASLPAGALIHTVLLLVLLLLLAAILVLLGARLLGLAPAAQTSVFQGGVRFNTYVGLAAAAALFGETGLVWGAVFLGVMIPLVNLACVACFAVLLGGKGGSRWRDAGRSTVTNPLILACLAGGGLNLAGIGIPAPALPVLELISRMALPLGLLAVGVGLDFRLLRRGGAGLWLACGFRLLFYPLLFVLLAAWLGLPAEARPVLLLFALLPTAPSAYILARQLGGDAPLMAAIITLQTLLAMLTMPLLLGLWGGTGGVGVVN